MYDVLLQNLPLFVLLGFVLVVLVAVNAAKRWGNFVRKSFTEPVKKGIDARLTEFQNTSDRKYNALPELGQAIQDERRARRTGGLFAIGSGLLTGLAYMANPFVGAIIGFRLAMKSYEVAKESHADIKAAKERQAKAISS